MSAARVYPHAENAPRADLVIDPAKLRAARKARGLSREVAATSIGRTYPSIQSYENGVNVPPGNVLIALAALYGVAVGDLCRHDAPAGAR